MIDAHCHLEFMENADDVVKEAKSRGMEAIVTSIADHRHNEETLKLHGKYPHFVFVCMGLHPAEVEYKKADVDFQIKSIEENKENIVAIGEVGLDYYHVKDEKRREETRNVFDQFIGIANKIKKPLVIHSREAMGDTLEALKNADVPVMMHFFSGSSEEMKEALDRGYYISFTTITVRSKKLRKLAKICPLDRILLETDSPWLDPEPEAKKSSNPLELTNRPWKISLTAEKIAKEKKTSKEEIIRATTENARKFFSL